MIRAAGQAPRHLITDRGKQFTARSFRRGCRRAGIRQRFGAIGKHGSIALVERCIRTLKEEGVRRWLAPIRWRTVGRELSLFADWCSRPAILGAPLGASMSLSCSDPSYPAA
jgi:transposase InsO family protein